MSIRTYLFLLVVFTTGTLLRAQDAQEMRQWTSKDGTESVTGRLFSQNATSVTLVLDNGRSREVKKEFLSQADLEYAEAAGVAGAAGTAGPAIDSRMADLLKGKLIDARGKAAELDPGVKPEFFLFYFSASWCPPCRTFTPELVRFYNRHKSKGNLHVVLYPHDRSEAESVAYLKEYRMPWPAIKFSKKDDRNFPRGQSGGIPALVLTDKDGTVLLANGAGLNREDFLQQTAKLLGGAE